MSEQKSKSTGLLSKTKIERLNKKKQKIEAFLKLSKQDAESTNDGAPMETSCKESADTAGICPEVTSGDAQCSASLESVNKTQEHLKKLRAEIRASQKASMQKAKLYLTLHEMYRQTDVSSTDQPQLYMMDLQHLLLYALQGNVASYKPRWCRLLRVGKLQSVAVLVVNSLSYQDFVNNIDCFPNISDQFSMKVEIISPYQYGMSLMDELFWVPLSCTKLWKLTETMREANQLKQQEVCRVKNTHDVFSRRLLLLNPNQLIMEGYPLPLQKSKNYVYSCETYQEVTDSSPLFAIDCEMCMTTRKKAELTRISVINENLEVLFDSYVKPFNPITDYLTQFSGITEHTLRNVSTRLIDIQKVVRSLLPPDAILCGQSLNADLHALEMLHPYVIDTSVIYNTTGNRQFKTGLRVLTARFLGRSIQDSSSGHNSVEDAMATMELVKLKLSKSLEFGDIVMGPMSNELLSMMYPEENYVPLRKKQKCDTESSKTNTDSNPVAVDQKNPSVVSHANLLSTQEDSQSGQAGEGETSQRKAFFTKGGASMYESFFKLLHESKKSALLIGSEEDTEPYKDQHGIVVSCQETDKAVVKEMKQRAGEHSFSWAQLQPVSMKQTASKKTMRKIDKWIKKVESALKDNTMFLVVFTGRESQTVHNAASFLKIT